MSFLLRKAATVSTPQMDISEDAGTWTIKTSTTLKTMELKFKVREGEGPFLPCKFFMHMKQIVLNVWYVLFLIIVRFVLVSIPKGELQREHLCSYIY